MDDPDIILACESSSAALGLQSKIEVLLCTKSTNCFNKMSYPVCYVLLVRVTWAQLLLNPICSLPLHLQCNTSQHTEKILRVTLPDPHVFKDDTSLERRRRFLVFL